jgi:hypothetical protein
VSARPTFDALIGHWQDGQRRLTQAEPQDRRALDRVLDAIVDELRRRLGGKFSVNELAQFYVDQGTDWCFAIATRVEPSNPAAWDLTTVAGAAFARYAREAADYTVGRRVGEPRPIDD